MSYTFNVELDYGAEKYAPNKDWSNSTVFSTQESKKYMTQPSFFHYGDITGLREYAPQAGYYRRVRHNVHQVFPIQAGITHDMANYPDLPPTTVPSEEGDTNIPGATFQFMAARGTKYINNPKKSLNGEGRPHYSGSDSFEYASNSGGGDFGSDYVRNDQIAPDIVRQCCTGERVDAICGKIDPKMCRVYTRSPNLATQNKEHRSKYETGKVSRKQALSVGGKPVGCERPKSTQNNGNPVCGANNRSSGKVEHFKGKNNNKLIIGIILAIILVIILMKCSK